MRSIDECRAELAASAAKGPRACLPCSSVRGSWQKRRSISPPPARRSQRARSSAAARHGWANKVEGGRRASSRAGIKAEAQTAGRHMAIQRGVEHFIHNSDGTIALGEVVAHRQPGLSPANDQDLDPLGNDRVVACHVNERSDSLSKLRAQAPGPRTGSGVTSRRAASSPPGQSRRPGSMGAEAWTAVERRAPSSSLAGASQTSVRGHRRARSHARVSRKCTGSEAPGIEPRRSKTAGLRAPISPPRPPVCVGGASEGCGSP
jgi:Uncharacterized protein conserved in bacteria (DUF2188)